MPAIVLAPASVVALGQYAANALRERDAVGAYDGLRRQLARVILLGLEILLLADIIRTIVVDQTVESVLVLGVIVVIRIVLSFSLQVEIEGSWPWTRWRTGPTITGERPAPPGSGSR